MHECGLSYNEVMSYLETLIRLGCVELVGSTYQLLAPGRQFLEIIGSIALLVPSSTSELLQEDQK